MAAIDSAYVTPGLIASLNPKPEFIPLYMTGRYATSIFDMEQYRTMGVGTLGSYEEAPDELAGGYAAGVSIAERTLPIYENWGAPTHQGYAIFCGADTNVSPAQIPQYLDGFRGFNDVSAGMYAAGCYGNGLLINALVEARLVQVKGWLSASESYYGYDRTNPNVGMWQTDGVVAGTDADMITDMTALGVWWAPGQPYVNVPPFANPRRDNMFYVAQDPRGEGQIAFGPDWAIDMDSPGVSAQWLSQPDCLFPTVQMPDAAHWDQAWRKVRTHAGAAQSLASVTIAPTLDVAALATALVAKLPSTELTNADVEADVRAALLDTHITIS